MKNWYKKRLYLWKLMDIGIWFVCAAIVDLVRLLMHDAPVIFSLVEASFRFIFSVFTVHGLEAKYYMAAMGCILLIITVFYLLLFTFPIIILYYGFSMAARKNLFMRVTFKDPQELDYFRDELKGISPATISLMMDLKIEGKKDLSATLLSLELKKKIRMEDGKPLVTDRSSNGLLESEKELLRLISEKHLDLIHIAQWQQVCIKEAEAAGYVKRNKQLKGFLGRLSVLLAIFIFCLLSVIFSWGTIQRLSSEMTEEAPYAEALLQASDEGEIFEILEREMKNPETQQFMDMIVKGTVFIVNCLLIFLLPGVILIYTLVFFLSRPRIIRTFKGQVLAGQVVGLKNFIHDFSNLSRAQKEQMALWDHFLIYAVVLEENKAVVDEIGEMWNLSLSKYLLNFQ